MSYPTDPIASGGSAPARPTTVSISSYLLFLVALLQLLTAITAFAVASDYQRIVEDAYADTDGGDEIAAFTSVTIIGFAIFGLLVGVGLVVLAIFNNRGKNASRITTWVVGGIFLCCGGMGLISQAAGGSMNFGGQADANAPSPEELQQALSDGLPSWYEPLSLVLSLIGVLALLVALILLALPPSNEFFRKREPEWQAPAGGAPGYQAYPAYPATGGTPAPPAGQPPASGTTPGDSSPTDPTRPEDPQR